MRHLENASEILRTKANKNGKYYDNPKYVRMACGTAYSGVLLAVTGMDAAVDIVNKIRPVGLVGLKLN